MTEVCQERTTKARRTTVLLATLLITLVFLGMIRDFLGALFLAAVLAGMARPLHRLNLRWLKGRDGIAAGVTLVGMILLVLGPLVTLGGIIAAQALELSEIAVPWFREQISGIEGTASIQLPDWVPFREQFDISWNEVGAQVGELAGRAGKLIANSLSAASRWTVSFFLGFFVMLYAMYFFIKEGPAIRDAIEQTIPLPEDLKIRLVEKGVSVIRATIKGTLVIGIVQGVLGGTAFAIVGIKGAAFWGLVMAIASVIPGIGTAIIWVPAVIYLFANGQLGASVGLGLWCAIVVGTADNVLRPRLVGNDTKMPDLLILVSTFGGLAMFGAIGLLVGPTIAAVFLLMWDIFGQTFGEAYTRNEADNAAAPDEARPTEP